MKGEQMEQVKYIGRVSSPLKTLADCPLQESEGAPPVTVTIDKEYWPAVEGLQKGDRILLFTWLHQGNRNTLVTKPRNNPKAKDTGIFATRSPDRPNPIGLHEVEITNIESLGTIQVSNLEVLDGTPVIDIKPVI